MLSITDLLDHYLKIYEDFIVIGDFNESETSPALDSFLDEQKCKNIIKSKTCFKSVKGSCIDLILTSRPSLHQFTNVFETGVSDHHLLIYIMLKSTYTKMEPKVISKRCFKNFSEQSFLQDLKQGLSDTGNCSDFNNEFKNTLNNHAPIKSSKVRGNTKPHVNKVLRKEIMKRSNLKNIANKSGKIEDKKRYKIQRNVVTKLNKKLKKAYFKEKLPNGKDVKDIWNFCKPYFTNKGVCNDEKIILVEKEEVLRKDSKISDTFNNYFVNITDELGIYKWGNIPQNCLDSTEKIKYFNNHPSIKTIQDKFTNSFSFKFEFVSTDIEMPK